MTRSIRSLVLVTAFALAVAACGGNGTAASDDTAATTSTAASDGAESTTLALCDAVPADGIEALLGQPVEGVQTTSGSVTECLWTSGDSAVSAIVGTGDLTEVLTVASSDDTVKEPVEGYGDSAFVQSGFVSLDSATTDGVSLWVTRGDTTIIASAKTSGGEPDRGALEAVAEYVLDEVGG